MRFWPLLFTTLALLSLFPSPSINKTDLSDITCPSSKPLLCAYFLGDKKELSRKTLSIHRELNLLHLMTPSGLHLGSLLIIFNFVFKRKTPFLYLLSVITFPITGIDSFKRMILFAILKSIPLIKLNNHKTFLLTFFLSALAGQLSKNPLSFCFSFLFLGVLLFSPNRLFMFVQLLLAQAIIGEWMNYSFSPLTAIVGLILSFSAPILLILFLIEFLIPILPFSDWWLNILEFIHSLLRFPLPLFFLIAIPIFYYSFRPKLLRIALPLVILITPGTLSPNRKGAAFPSPPPKEFISKREGKDRIVFSYENKMKCYVKPLGDEWRTSCYK